MKTKVKVGGVHYTVEEKEGLMQRDNFWGEVNYYNAEIIIDSSLSDDRKEQVLIHEVTHAIFLEAGYKEQDEDMINRVSIVLHQVLKDNPHLLNPSVNIAHVTIDSPQTTLNAEDINELLKHDAVKGIKS